jgi:hypothetical protein
MCTKTIKSNQSKQNKKEKTPTTNTTLNENDVVLLGPNTKEDTHYKVKPKKTKKKTNKKKRLQPPFADFFFEISDRRQTVFFSCAETSIHMLCCYQKECCVGNF